MKILYAYFASYQDAPSAISTVSGTESWTAFSISACMSARFRSIFISSEMEEVIRCSNRITIMRDGKKAGELVGPFSGDTQNEILKIIAGDKA